MLLFAVGCLLVSGVAPQERLTWVLEVATFLIGAPVLIFSHARFPLTPLLYRLLFLHSLILMVGGHYTYAEVPLGFWMQDMFSFSRNHYDRIGHLAQGFIPAILTREVLLRRSPLRPGKWLFFLVTSVCLAFSALYELVEWWSAVILGQGADAFLGTQGDVWDSQWDMFLALAGTVSAQISLSGLHERELVSLSLSRSSEK